MAKLFIVLGSLSAFLAVALGAFGAHGLKSKLSKEMFSIYETAVNYHIIHALALIMVGILAKWLSDFGYLNWSGWLFLAGTVIFSGSLYVLSVTGIRQFGAITPIGGVSFLIGWLLLALVAWKQL